MRGLSRISFAGALLVCASALAVVAVPASAQGSYSPYNETAAAALARYVRALAADPKDFNSLIGAGRAALELGDTQAAAGFFARADEVDPKSPFPQEGMGAVQVANGDAKAAMPYFSRAQQLGAAPAALGCDRGLAYDLLGQQAQAQTDYRAALAGADADEARRRLALSLAISGDKTSALATLAPLSAKGDATANRIRAFVLALAGDTNAAMGAIDAAMPGSWARVAPFLSRLPTLPAGEKAAAVNLGIFPDSTTTSYAYAAATPAVPSTAAMSQTMSTDRLSGIDSILHQPSAASAAQQAWQQSDVQAQAPARPQPVQIAYAPQPRPATVQRTEVAGSPKVWLQLASGRDETALSSQFRRMKSRDHDLFQGITAYVAESPDRARLLIGPFRGPSDADIFQDDLRSVGIDAFRWTNSESDRIVPIAVE
ncbi:MAG TPA: SPOR domain-containing protein [Sphingomicrobium sp.]|nr:SPOR domain-containing protein [Sphingomicrobium sp.]